MPKFTIDIPLPEEQHGRNPKWRWITEEVTNPETGEVYLVPEKERIVKSESVDGKPIYEMNGEPVWGLGCPTGCGRFWEFTADDVMEEETVDSDGVNRVWLRGKRGCHFKPKDTAAYSGVDGDGNPTRGYLNFRPDPATPSTLKNFECDRCGVEIKLVRP